VSEPSITPEERLHHLEGHYADRVTLFRQRLARVGLSRVLIVLLDIGKNAHWATAWTASGQELVLPHRLPTTQVGLRQFLQMTADLSPCTHPTWCCWGTIPPVCITNPGRESL
jgi:hypothetical protein